MGNKNVFENENVKLRLIDLEYDYKQKFASTIASEVKKAKKDFEANWLFCYEVLKSQEFKEVSASTASAFKNMKEHNVSFLKANF